jgi:hypothetical protein
VDIFHKNKRIVAIVFGIFLAVLQHTTYALDANANAKDVADKLNALYQHTQACNNDEPAYYCSGIIVHGQVVPAKDGDDKPALSWYLPTYRNIGSFSYLRKDITPSVGEPIWVNTGYILTPADDLEANKEFKYTIYCAYPGDGGTFDGLETSCVYSRTAMMGEEVSSDQIHLVADYITKYLDNPFTKWKPVVGIGFHTTKAEFDLAMHIYQYIFKDHLDKTDESFCGKDGCRVHNELIISAWEKKNVPDAQVPIMAFFAIINDDQNPFFKNTGRTSTSKEEMQQLFADAEAYSKATNYTRRIPVITIDMAKLRKGEPDIFAPAVNPAEIVSK